MAGAHHGPVDDKRDGALGDAIKAMFCGNRRVGGTRQPGKHKQIKFSQIFHVLRRLVIIAAAVWYLATSIQTSIASMKVLRGVRNAPMQFEAYDTNNVLPWMGTSTIRKSPLVMQILQNDTTPRNYTIYLEANGVFSTAGCKTPKYNPKLYGNFFLRLAYGSTARDVAQGITEYAHFVPIAPIVDCSFTPLTRGLDTAARVFYVMRNKTDPNDLLLQTVRFSMQDYKVREMNEFGPVALTNYQYIKDMSHPTVYKKAFTGALGYPFEPATIILFNTPEVDDKGWWVTTSIPSNPTVAPKKVITSSRTGFYVSSDSEQANIKNLYWTVDPDPITALTKWNWKGEPLLKDSWAWVHFIHVGFAINSMANLALLVLVMYRNLQKGKIWIGDAFVSVSATLMLRGAWIFISWCVNGFWSLMEFCLHDAHKIANTQEIFIHAAIMRADFLTLFLGAVSVLGYLTRERIDPAFAIVVFEISFACRFALIKWVPAMMDTVIAFAQADHDMAVLDVSEKVAYSSPCRLWTTHKLPPKNFKYIFSCLFPFFTCANVVVLLYVIARKIYRRVNHENVYVQGGSNSGTGTAVSEKADGTSLLFKRNLTLFEIATGAELQNRYGVVSDYENFLFIKGMKYASADGIYSSGFVIANGKFLIGIADIWMIGFLKVTGMRLRNVFIFAIEGNTVQQRAKLVYPQTLSWTDLLHLNLMVLS